MVGGSFSVRIAARGAAGMGIMKKPVIGIPLDSEDGGGYSKLPWYAVRHNYVESVVAAGGIPLLLPHHPELIDDYVARIDGLLVIGGAFDVDPALFGATSRHETVVLKEGRTAFEIGITQRMLALGRPILGICGGQQLLNVMLGGSLIQHIPDEVENPLPHEQPNPRTEPGHDVIVTPGSLLHRITGQVRFPVNSAHHQAVLAVGPGVLASAHAEDGVIEAVEKRDAAFCLGVQWHPEYHISPADGLIFQAFLQACGAK
jgi:putative glutamine amidotransferase